MSHLHEKVSGLVDGELGGAARTRALNHLRRCADCRAEVRATLEVKRRLGDLAAAEPPADLRSALGSLPSPALTSSPSPVRRHPVRRSLVGAAAGSAALLTLAYAVGAPEEAKVATVTPPVEEFTADFAGTSGASPLADPAVSALGADGPTLTLLAVGQLAAPMVAGLVASRARGDDPQAVEALERASEAGRDLGYTGHRRVAVFEGAGPSLVNVRVEHVPGQGTSFDLAGQGNDAATFVAAHEAAHTETISSGPLSMLVDTFDIAMDGRDEIAHRGASVVTASRAGEVVARFWVDDATGLLLRRDLYEQGQVVRSSQFMSLELSARRFLPHLPPELGASQGTALSMTIGRALNDEGWSCPERLTGGFRLIGLQRLPDDVVQATYTDGLSTVAVYEQRGHLDPEGLQGFTQVDAAGEPVHVLDGLPSLAVWESNDTVYTVVSDATEAATMQAVAALPHESATGPGATDRVTTGLQRLGSLVNPVD